MEFLVQATSEILQCPDCKGSVTTAIAAAFASMGHYLQAEILTQILDHGLQNFAVLAYIVAFVGALISMAMGSGYRFWVWFVMGPALFYWLLDSRIPNSGNAWLVANQPRDMREVWSLSESGLKSMKYVKERNITIPTDATTGDATGGPSEPAQVSYIFSLYDWIVSDTIQQLISWLGVSTPLVDNKISTDKWDLVSNLKWQYLNTITSATITNVNLRVMFTRFLASECGDAFIRGLDKTKLVAFSTMRDIPANASVLQGANPYTLFPAVDQGSCQATYAVTDYFRNNYVPTPMSEFTQIFAGDVSGAGQTHFVKQSRFAELWNSRGVACYSSAENPDSYQSSPAYSELRMSEAMRCDNMFLFVMLGLRTEAEHQLYQLLKQAPNGVLPKDLPVYLFDGWKIPTDIVSSDCEDCRLDFLRNLILTHLIRNELKLLPQLKVDKRDVASVQLVENSKDYQREIAAPGKFVEIYQWALMVPYFQGILLYMLAAGYPFACMLILIPGLHKILFQWMKLWLWVKTWDIGFAILMVLERSVWSSVGRSYGRNSVYKIVDDMGKLNINDPAPFAAERLTAAIPEIQVETQISNLVDVYNRMIQLFDKALVLSTTTDFDLANTYYIYIMSALYFAVPTVLGFVVLGVNNGISGMISNSLERFSGSAGQAAERAAGERASFRASAAKAISGQEEYAKRLRAGGMQSLASRLLSSENERVEAGMKSQLRNLESRGVNAGLNAKWAGMQAIQGYMQGKSETAYGMSRIFESITGGGGGGRRRQQDQKPPNPTDPNDRNKGGGGAIQDLYTGGGMSAGSRILGWMDGAYRMGSGMITSKYQPELYMEQGRTNALSFAQEADATKLQTKASLAELNQSRGGAFADFSASQQQHLNYALSFGQANAGYLGAVGANGLTQINQLPTNVHGMAMSGMLGKDVTALAMSQAQGDLYNSWQGGNDRIWNQYGIQRDGNGNLAGTALTLEKKAGDQYDTVKEMADRANDVALGGAAVAGVGGVLSNVLGGKFGETKLGKILQHGVGPLAVAGALGLVATGDSKEGLLDNLGSAFGGLPENNFVTKESTESEKPK